MRVLNIGLIGECRFRYGTIKMSRNHREIRKRGGEIRESENGKRAAEKGRKRGEWENTERGRGTKGEEWDETEVKVMYRNIINNSGEKSESKSSNEVNLRLNLWSMLTML